jgi:hypothetical protein
MKLRDQMQVTNITSDETTSIDIGGFWLTADTCHVGIRFTEDDQADVEFHMMLDPDELRALRDYLTDKISSQPIKLN